MFNDFFQNKSFCLLSQNPFFAMLTDNEALRHVFVWCFFLLSLISKLCYYCARHGVRPFWVKIRMICMFLLNSKLEQLKVLTAGIWQRKRVVLSCAVLGTMIGCLFVMTLPNKYESNAKVYADTKSLLKPLLQGMAVHGDSDEEIRVMAQNLLSRPNLEKIAQQSGLHVKYVTPESYEIFLVNFQQKISLTGSKKQNLFTISYQDEDPKMAKRVVELTLQSLVDATVGQSRQDNSSATDFLNEQIAEQKSKLELAERVLAQFKQQYQNVLPQRGGSYFQEVSQLKQQIEEVEMMIGEKIASLTSLQNSVYSGPGENSGSMIDVRTPYDDRISQLEASLVNLEVRYTDKHPDIIEIKALLEGLFVEKNKYQKEMLSSVAMGGFGLADQDEKSALSAASFQIASFNSELNSLKARKDLLSRRLESKLLLLDEIPRIEAELTSLTRDYDTTRDLYQNLLQRRDSAELSKSMNENTSEIKFRVIEPPSEPLMPSGPPRSALYIIVFLLSVSFGFSLAFLLSQFSGSIQSREQLQQIIVRGNVLPSLPDYSIKASHSKRKFLVFVFAMLVLAFLVCALVAHEVLTTHSPLFWVRGYL